jgi:hypothetical protein
VIDMGVVAVHADAELIYPSRRQPSPAFSRRGIEIQRLSESRST